MRAAAGPFRIDAKASNRSSSGGSQTGRRVRPEWARGGGLSPPGAPPAHPPPPPGPVRCQLETVNVIGWESTGEPLTVARATSVCLPFATSAVLHLSEKSDALAS
jgi:hypothetical protein